jgi:DnaJ-class molecular chaperone
MMAEQRRRGGGPAKAQINPGDETAPGTHGTGEDFCPRCKGSGQLRGAQCPHCGGTGRIVEGIGGG